MKIISKAVWYKVVSGTPESATSYLPAKSLKEARQVKKDCQKTNPHQGGGYHILKVTTIEEQAK